MPLDDGQPAVCFHAITCTYAREKLINNSEGGKSCRHETT